MPNYIITFGGLIAHVRIDANTRRAVFVREHHHHATLAVDPNDISAMANMKPGTVPLGSDSELIEMLAGRNLFSIEDEIISTNGPESLINIEDSFRERVPRLTDTFMGNSELHDQIFDDTLHPDVQAHVTYKGGSLSSESCFEYAIEFVPPTPFGLFCASSAVTYEVNTASLLRFSTKDPSRYIELKGGAHILLLNHSGGGTHWEHFKLLSKNGSGIATLKTSNYKCIDCQRALNPEITTGTIQCTNSQWP